MDKKHPELNFDDATTIAHHTTVSDHSTGRLEPDTALPTDVSGELSEGQKAKAVNRSDLIRRRFGLISGVVLALALYFLMPSDLPHELRATAAITILLASWWMSEAIPIAVTALLPLVLFPAVGVAEIGSFSGAYTSPVIFLFMGGFMLALAMQRWNLHRRIALYIVWVVGGSPATIILGFMIATGFLSMWVSNTATAVMMLPIGISVLGLIMTLAVKKGQSRRRRDRR